MTTPDDPGQPALEGWLTLTEAASRSGYSREALRLRVRRKKLRSEKRNDGQVRVNLRDIEDLPPLSDQVNQVSERDLLALTTDSSMTLLAQTMDDLRMVQDDLRTARTDLDKIQEDRMVDRGRAERAEAQTQAALDRAEEAERRTSMVEARLTAAEAALSEARTPWTVRVIRAFRDKVKT